jgi:hypothetical protein
MACALPNPLSGLCHPTDNHEGSCRFWFLSFCSVLVSPAATLVIVCFAIKQKGSREATLPN